MDLGEWFAVNYLVSQTELHAYAAPLGCCPLLHCCEGGAWQFVLKSKYCSRFRAVCGSPCGCKGCHSWSSLAAPSRLARTPPGPRGWPGCGSARCLRYLAEIGYAVFMPVICMSKTFTTKYYVACVVKRTMQSRALYCLVYTGHLQCRPVLCWAQTLDTREHASFIGKQGN